MRSLVSDYVFIHPRNGIISSVGRDCEYITKSTRSGSYASRSLSSPGYIHIPDRTPSTSAILHTHKKEKDSKISLEDSMLNLLKQIEDQIIDFQADCAKLKGVYRNPVTYISKPNPSQKSSAQKASSELLSRLEAEIIELRDRLEYETSRESTSSRQSIYEDSIIHKVEETPATEANDADFIPLPSADCARFKKEKTKLVDIRELLIGIFGFFHVLILGVYFFFKAPMYLLTQIIPFHKFL
ncbi:hypothetical protein TWF730_001968 [Orbilia blumenaviensis]|uniref:Uncharacterized protein n=1 Tax=Orbilia blumenaviensis TaxID=1796055 RepID=A0AAV9UDJ9_9PEZI